MRQETLYIAVPMINFSKSGGQRVLCRLASEWALMGHTVEIILCYESQPYFPINDNVRITHLRSKGFTHNFRRVTAYLSRNYSKYDCIVANFYRTAYYVFAAELRQRGPRKGFYYIQAYEPVFFPLSLSNWRRNCFRFLAWGSYFLPLTRIVNSKIYYKYRNIRSNKVVFPGLDLSVYYAKDLLFFHPTLKIGTIGRTESWKGTKDVCDAMGLLKSRHFLFEFYIAFNDFATIDHTFVRPDGDDNLAQFYRDMDIIIAVPTDQFGAIHYPVIESMAVGTSIVCTDFFPSTEKNSYKVGANAPAEIADAVLKIAQNRDEAISKRIRARHDIQQFDWKNTASRFIAYLEENK